MTEINTTLETTSDEPSQPIGFTEKGLAIWVIFIAAVVLTIAMSTGNVDLVTLGNMFLRVGIVLAVAVLLPLFYLSQVNNVDAKIFSHPVGLAVYLGAVVVACGVAIG